MSLESGITQPEGARAGNRPVAGAKSGERARRIAGRARRGIATVVSLALGVGSAVSVVTPAQAAPSKVCTAALSTRTNQVVLLALPDDGSAGSDSYSGGYLAPARASEWTDYSLEGDATTPNTLAVSFRQKSSNGPSLQFSAGQNSLGPLRLNNGGWGADGNLALPAGTIAPGVPFHFKIEVSGQQVTVWIDGVQRAQYSRPWLPAAGTIGIRVSGDETGTLDNLVVRHLGTGKYLYADDFESRAVGTTGATAAGYPGLEVVSVCTVPDSPADAYWIWSPGAPSVNNWTAFRKTFSVDLAELPAKVNARLAVETKYWLYINDELVVFEGGVKRGPNRNDSYADNVDLRPHLRDGENTIAILAVSYGRGGYSAPYSGKAGLFFEAADLDLRSNATWKALKLASYGSMSIDTNYRLAEPNLRYDARAEIADWADWTTADFDDAAWPAAVTSGNEGSSPWNALVDSPIPLLRYDDYTTFAVTDPQVKVTATGNLTQYEVRLPVNHQLTPYVKLGPATEEGRTVGLRTDHATVKGSGTEQAVQGEYVTKAGAQEYESLVWMNGDKIFVTAPAGVEVVEFGYRLSGYDTDFDGAFTSDDPFLNKLWTMARDTLYVTMRDSYMDCPDRERSQWWGDATNELEEAFYALDPQAAALARKGITNLMGFRNGDLIPTQAPAASFSELPAQSLAAVMSFWMYYEYSGDRSALEETYLPSVAYLRTYNMAADGLLQHDHGGTWHWHDWGYNEDGRLIDTLWYHIALNSTIKSATVLGVPATDPDVAWLQERVDSIANNIERLWVDGKGYYESTGDGRADDRANALAVYSGLADPAHYEQIRDVLVNVKKSSPYMDKYVLEALYQMGYADEAVARMKNRYAPMVNDPDHSTLWEFFAGPEQDAAGTYNHAWTGGPLTMLSRYAAGIQPLKPGFAEFAVKPQPGSLKTVEAKVHSVNGKIDVQIDATDPHRYLLEVSVPTSTVAEVYLPATEMEDLSESGAPLTTATPGVLGLAVDDATGQTVVRLEPGDYAFAVAGPPAAVSLPKVGVVAPGQRAAGVLKVENTGLSAIDSISAVVTLPGLGKPITLAGGPVAIGETGNIPFTIAVPQGARSGSSFDAEAEVTISYAGQQRSFTLPIAAYLRVAADVVVESVTLGARTGDYPRTGEWVVTTTVRNNGSAAVTGQLAARSVVDVLESGAPSELVTIPANGTVQIPLTMSGGGRYWMPIMQSVTVDFVDRGAVLATGTSAERIKWYGPNGRDWRATGAGAIPGATDFVDFGDGGSGSTGNAPGNVRPGPTETAHNLRWNYRNTIPVGGTNTEGGLTRRFTWSRDGSWYSVDMDVTSGQPFVLSLRETADTSAPSTLPVVQSRHKRYQILVDDVLVRQVMYLMPNEGVVGNTLANYQVLVDDPAALDADADGKVTVTFRYLGGDEASYDPSLTDLWVSAAPDAVADDRAPTVSAAPAQTTVYGDNGWITEPTTLVVQAVDDLDPSPAITVSLDDGPSGRYEGPVAVTSDGTHVLGYSASDASSNASADKTLTVRIDRTEPVPAFGDWPAGPFQASEVPQEPACLGTDATSGVASCTQSGYSQAIGEHTITQTVVDNAGNRATATLEYLVVAVDKAALAAVLQEKASLNPDDYTTSSWNAVLAVVDGSAGAQAVHDDPDSTRTEVDAATAALTQAIAELVRRGDPTVLVALIAAATGLEEKLDGFTDASAGALRTALAEARAVDKARADKSQAQLDVATSGLLAAVNGLETKPAVADKTVLQHVHDEAAALSNANGVFTSASWTVLQKELADSRAVLADATTTQPQIDGAVKELTSALAGLEVVKPVTPIASRVKLNQSQLRLAKRTSFRLEEAVYYTNARPAYSGAVVWKSSNPRIATVSSGGLVSAKKSGTVRITATTVRADASGRKLSTSIKVTVVKSKSKSKVTKVSASVPKTMRVGQAAYLTGKYSSTKATGVKVSYRSSARSVATVDVAGRVLATKKGTVKITVKAGKKSKTYKITVR